MDIRPCRCATLPFPLRPMPVLPFYQFPSIGRLVARVILVSLFILATSAIPPRRPIQVPLGSLACTVILSTEVLHANLVSQSSHVAISSRRKYLIDFYPLLVSGPIPLPNLGFPTRRTRRQLAEDRVGRVTIDPFPVKMTICGRAGGVRVCRTGRTGDGPNWIPPLKKAPHGWVAESAGTSTPGEQIHQSSPIYQASQAISQPPSQPGMQAVRMSADQASILSASLSASHPAPPRVSHSVSQRVCAPPNQLIGR